MYLATARPRSLCCNECLSTLDHRTSKALAHVRHRLSDTIAKLIIDHHDLRGNISLHFEKVRNAHVWLT
jgi:hypothetical protein